MADLLRVAGQAFCNTSALGMKRLMGDQDNIGENLRSYIQAFTPREVIKLMVNLIFIEDDQALTQGGIVRSLYDPNAGTVCAGKRLGGCDHRPAHRYVL